MQESDFFAPLRLEPSIQKTLPPLSLIPVYREPRTAQRTYQTTNEWEGAPIYTRIVHIKTLGWPNANRLLLMHMIGSIREDPDRPDHCAVIPWHLFQLLYHLGVPAEGDLRVGIDQEPVHYRVANANCAYLRSFLARIVPNNYTL